MRALVSVLLIASAGFAFSEDTAPADAPQMPDPTAAVVAQDLYIYRQRDLDAMLLVAQRHAKQKLSTIEEEQIRQCLVQAFTAREPLMNALANLPKSLSQRARDQITLDLLAYQADVAPRKVRQGDVISTDSVTPGAATPEAAPDTTQAPAPAAASPGDSVIVRLPPLIRTRNIDGVKRQMTLGIALFFANQDISSKIESKSPLIQDAVLSYIEKMSPAEFSEPDQTVLKDGLAKAVIAKIPEFPADGILIPQLEVSVPEGK